MQQILNFFNFNQRAVFENKKLVVCEPEKYSGQQIKGFYFMTDDATCCIITALNNKVVLIINNMIYALKDAYEFVIHRFDKDAVFTVSHNSETVCRVNYLNPFYQTANLLEEDGSVLSDDELDFFSYVLLIKNDSKIYDNLLQQWN